MAFSGDVRADEVRADEAQPEQVEPAKVVPEAEFRIESPIMQGAVVIGHAPQGTVRLVYDGQDLPLTADGRFVIGLHRDTGKEVTLTATLADGSTVEHVLAVTPREFNIQRVNGLPPKTVNMPPEMLEQRKAEVAEITAARATPSLDLFWTQPFIWPASGRISGIYGSQRIRNGVPGSPHYGVDIANKTGTPMVAPASGIVRVARSGFSLEGGLIIIDHGFNLYSSMLHLSRIDVKPGDVLMQGQQIGAIGSTGRATGPHLHWGLRWGNIHVDPTTLPGLPPLPGASAAIAAAQH
ncbi:M23 family metallopeptidase [Pedomonas mirosovicensis]|uniref:M23 family metallopeptidase n=1 Tax=Pedomonas mirosovicensis TaxID=2908641 RepID=UPI0021682DED|nr:M23 family metallopeptidase [Pedomonas mirosovicensis]MCH8683746.1 M23 family metallopeptidase [Pedomonas mirosovicensis]